MDNLDNAALCDSAFPPMPEQPQVVAMAYVPWQHLQTVYEPDYGFERGTIFPELDKPWLPGGCSNG